MFTTSKTPPPEPPIKAEDVERLIETERIASETLSKMPEEYTRLYNPAMQILVDLIEEKLKKVKKELDKVSKM